MDIVSKDGGFSLGTIEEAMNTWKRKKTTS